MSVSICLAVEQSYFSLYILMVSNCFKYVLFQLNFYFVLIKYQEIFAISTIYMETKSEYIR